MNKKGWKQNHETYDKNRLQHDYNVYTYWCRFTVIYLHVYMMYNPDYSTFIKKKQDYNERKQKNKCVCSNAFDLSKICNSQLVGVRHRTKQALPNNEIHHAFGILIFFCTFQIGWFYCTLDILVTAFRISTTLIYSFSIETVEFNYNYIVSPHQPSIFSDTPGRMKSHC